MRKMPFSQSSYRNFIFTSSSFCTLSIVGRVGQRLVPILGIETRDSEFDSRLLHPVGLRFLFAHVLIENPSAYSESGQDEDCNAVFVLLLLNCWRGGAWDF